MTFKEVIIKTFIKNIRKYMSYYFSGTFCVAIFFVYTTLLFMDAIENNDTSEYPLQALFIVSCLIIFIFSILFINYAHLLFVKNQKKELGIYMIVGMNEKYTRKLLSIETALIGSLSIISGIVIGLLFSRFFQTIVQRLLNISDITYNIKPQSFIVTGIVFAVLFTVCNFISDYKISKEDVNSLINDSKKREAKKYKSKNAILFFLGLALIIFSVIFIIIVAPDNHINSSLWVLLTFLGSGYVGIFLVILNGVKLYVMLSYKKNSYYTNMLTVSGINQKYEQNSKMIIILALLASMIVLLVGSPIALVSISSDIAEKGNSDLIYVTYDNYNEEDVNRIVEKKEIEERTTKDIYYIVDEQSKEVKPVISASEYNEEMQGNIKVLSGEVYNMIVTWEPGTHGIETGSMVTIGSGDKSMSFKVCESIKGNWNYSSVFNTKNVYILSDEDFESVKQCISRATVNRVMYKENWRTTKDIVEKVKESLSEQLGNKYYVSSIIDIYNNLKSGYSTFLFACGFMCFMFFISTGCVLYFKQYNEIDEEKAQYIQLYKLGISGRTVKRAISVKLAIVYFMPFIGMIMGIMISYYLASLFGGDDIVTLFIRKAMIGVVCYVLSQSVFYIILRAKYLHEIFNSDTLPE